MDRKTGKEMAELTQGLTGGGPTLCSWFQDASIAELHEYILALPTTFNPHAYQLARTTLDIRLADQQFQSAAKLEEHTGRLVNQVTALVGLTRTLHWLTIVLIVFAVIQTIVMCIEYFCKTH